MTFGTPCYSHSFLSFLLFCPYQNAVVFVKEEPREDGEIPEIHISEDEEIPEIHISGMLKEK